MSFSFNVTGKTRDEVRAAVAAQMADVVKVQTVHARDQEAVSKVVDLYLDLVPEPGDGQQYQCSVYGSMSWNVAPGEAWPETPEDHHIRGASGGLNIWIA